MKKGIIVLTIISVLLLLVSCRKKYYQVTIDFDNGEEVLKYDVKENDLVEKPNDPVKKSHEFSGFYSGNKLYDFELKVTSDLNIKANWKQLEKFTITVNANNEEDVYTFKVSKNAKLETIPTPYKDGFEFIGWYVGSTLYDFDSLVVSNLEIEAIYFEIATNITHEVIFNYNNELENVSYTIIKYNTVTEPQTPVKEGYKFLGWYTVDDNKYNFDTKIINSFTLNAKWEKILTNEEKIAYAYNYHKNATKLNVTATGTATIPNVFMGVTINQSIYFEKNRDNDLINYYNSSYGSYKILFVSSEVTKYMKYEGTINTIVMTTGKTNKNLEAISVGEMINDLTNEQLSNNYGSGINDINYVLSEENILSATKLENKDNTYLVKIHLENSVNSYKDSIVFMNPEKSYKDSIVFTKIELTISLDENNHFKEIKISETYEIEVDAPIIGDTTQTVNCEFTEKYSY